MMKYQEDGKMITEDPFASEEELHIIIGYVRLNYPEWWDKVLERLRAGER